MFMKLTGDYSIFTLVVIGNMFASCVLVTKTLKYREKETNLTTQQAALFYFKFKCFKTKKTLESYH